MHGNFSMATMAQMIARKKRERERRKNRTMIYQVIVIFVYDALAAAPPSFAILSVCLFSFIFCFEWDLCVCIYCAWLAYNIWIVSR